MVLAGGRRTRPAEAAARVRQAGWAYLLAGGGTVIFLWAAGLPARPAGLVLPLLFGTAFVLAPRRWHRPRSRHMTRTLARVMLVANGARALLYLLGAAGWRAGGAPQPLLLVPAAAAAGVAVLLARALAAPGWDADGR